MKGRDPPLTKRRLTPADDPKILDEWQIRFNELQKEGLNKSTAYKTIADEFGTTRGTVYRWLSTNARDRHNSYLRTHRKKVDRTTQQEKNRSRIRFQLYRHIDEFVCEAFAKDEMLSAENITLRIYNHLIEINRPGILLKVKTLLHLIEQYESKNNRRLLIEVEDSDPVEYRLRSPLS